MILQILAGGVAAVAVTAKLYWNRVLRFLRIRKDEPETAETPLRGDRLRLATAGRPPRPSGIRLYYSAPPVRPPPDISSRLRSRAAELS